MKEICLILLSTSATVLCASLSLLALMAASKLDQLKSIAINIQQQPVNENKDSADPNKPVTPYDIDPEFDPSDWWKHDSESNCRN